jgi:single-stranded-DNA-specific exonuclease
MGNPKPVFVLRNATMEYPRFVGKESKHLSMQLVCGSNRFKAIYFSFVGDRDIIKHGNKFDVAFSLSEDNWNDERKLSINIIDIKQINEINGQKY